MKDCFAKTDTDECGILKETLCKKGVCPFYKSRKKYEYDKLKYSEKKKVGGNEN